ncbi:excinuclease ABC subunit B, partial [Arcobacter suis]
FRVNGDVIDIYPAYFEDEYIRVEFFGDEVESITKHEYLTNEKTKSLEEAIIYSVNPFVVTSENLGKAVKQIEEELDERLDYFTKEDKLVEYQRLKQRVEFDLEMIEGTGMCKGIENYARHLTGLKPGQTPYSLMDYFEQIGKDFLLIVDESHVSLPQFRGMHAADR